MNHDPMKISTVPLTDTELNYSPEEWAEALVEDPSCIRAYLKAAEERGRRRGLEERDELRARVAELETTLRALTSVNRAVSAVEDLAPRDSGKVET